MNAMLEGVTVTGRDGKVGNRSLTLWRMCWNMYIRLNYTSIYIYIRIYVYIVNGSNSSLKRMMATSILIQCKPMINQMFQRTKLCCPTTLCAAVVFQCLLKVQKSRTENTKAGRFRFLSKKVVSGTLAYMSGPCHTLPYGCKDLRNPPSPRLKLPWAKCSLSHS